MLNPRLLLTRSGIPGAAERLARLVPGCRLDVFEEEEAAIPREELLRRAPGCDGMVCLLTDKIDAAVLDAAGPQLRVVSSFSVGTDHIDIPAATERGVVVCNTPGVLSVATAETAVALTFAVSRLLPECIDSVKAGEWGTWAPMAYAGVDVSDSVIGVVGMGDIGATFARMMSPFARRIVYTANSGPKPAVEAELGAEYCTDLGELLAQADVVSVHTPLTPQTERMFDAAAFAAMKPGAVLINTARGGVVDQPALYEALASGQIRAAGLDVTTPEPLPVDDPLLTLRNCVVLPHIGSASVRTRVAMADLAVDNLAAALRGEEPAAAVNWGAVRS